MRGTHYSFYWHANNDSKESAFPYSVSLLPDNVMKLICNDEEELHENTK